MAADYLGIPREFIRWFPTVDPDLCTGCRNCIETCASGVYSFDEVRGVTEVLRPLNCVVLCDTCSKFCPSGAISFPDKGRTREYVTRLLALKNGGSS